MSALIFLDYDGTLVDFTAQPEQANPDAELTEILTNLAAANNIQVVLISGRDKPTMEKWFSHLPCGLVAEHGVWLKEQGKEWVVLAPFDASWKKTILPLVKAAAKPLAGSVIENKDYSISWHYRQAEPTQADKCINAFVSEITPLLESNSLELIFGKFVIEIRNKGIDKGKAACRYLEDNPAELVMVIGDDRTDEDMFAELPQTALSIKVGEGETKARYRLNGVGEVRELLRAIAKRTPNLKLKNKS